MCIRDRGTTKPTNQADKLTRQMTYLEREIKSREKGEKAEYLSLQRRMPKAKGKDLFIAKTKVHFPNAIIRSRRA